MPKQHTLNYKGAEFQCPTMYKNVSDYIEVLKINTKLARKIGSAKMLECAKRNEAEIARFEKLA